MGREPIFAMAGPSEAVGDSVGILASNENTGQCTLLGQAREGSMQRGLQQEVSDTARVWKK